MKVDWKVEQERKRYKKQIKTLRQQRKNRREKWVEKEK